MTAPYPAVPTFTDGALVQQYQLNGLAQHINDLYIRNLGAFRTTVPVCTLRLTSTQSIAYNTDARVASWDVADINTDNMWSSANPSYMVVNTAGIYVVFAQIVTQGTATNLGVRVVVNGFDYINDAVGSYEAVALAGHAQAVVYLPAGSVVSTWVFQTNKNPGVLDTAHGSCRMGAFRLSDAGLDLAPITPNLDTVSPGGATIPPSGGGSGGSGGGGSSSDGTQAAVTQSWGAVIAGDEFGYTGAPDPNKWAVYVGTGNAGNGQRVASAWSVANGICTCSGDANGNTGGMEFKQYSNTVYRVEVRMRVYATGSGGTPYHPVLIMWPNSDQWPQGGEDDYAETDIGSPTMDVFIHWPNQSSGSAQSTASVTTDITQWHNWAIERSATAVTGWLDGVQWFKFTNSSVLGVPGPMHPTIQLDDVASGATQPANMDIDWIRIYNPPS